MFDKSPAEILLLAGFAIAFCHFLYLGAHTFKWTTGDEMAAGVAQLSFFSGAIGSFLLAFHRPIATANGVAASALLLGALTLYEWARRTVRDRGLHIAWSGDVPESLSVDGPYRWIRHPFYASYILAFSALLTAVPTPPMLALVAINVALFVHAACNDEGRLAKSPLAGAYASYKRLTSMFIPLPRRTKLHIR